MALGMCAMSIRYQEVARDQQRKIVALRTKLAEAQQSLMKEEAAYVSVCAELAEARQDGERLDWLDQSWVSVEKFPNWKG